MTVSIDWKSLGFQYVETPCFVKCEYTSGKWGALEQCSEPYLKMHIAATCLHYGQACFEGMKAFRRKDGSIALFRPEENAKRLIRSAERLAMQGPSVDLFIEACKKAVKLNEDYVPPYGSGASLYLRPLLVGSTARIGVHPADDYTFLVLATPVGPYFKNGFLPIKVVVQEDYDRAAPRGIGHVKAAGNYAAALVPDTLGKAKGYPATLYLDSSTKEHIDEFGAANFLAITTDGKYVTPDSTSALPSITNKSLQVLAQDFGLTVERRVVSVNELGQFAEIGACGTAAVITPVHIISYRGKDITFGKPDVAGATLTRLYKELQGIQYGDVEDRHGWMLKV